MFFNYRGDFYSLQEFLRTEGDLLQKGWQGYVNWWYGGGLLIRIVNSCESVVVASYSC